MLAAKSDGIISVLRKSSALEPGLNYEITLTISRMSSVRLKVEFSARVRKKGPADLPTRPHL